MSSNPWKAAGDIWKEVQTFLKGIVLSSMDSLPDAVAGQILHYDKKFYLTSANRRIISRASQVLITSITVANTTTETTIYTGSVAADTISAGKRFIVSGEVQFSTANANAALTIRIYLNETLMGSLTSSLGNVSDKAGFFETKLTVRTVGETGTVSCFVSLQLDEKSGRANIGSTVFDSTAGSDLVVTAQWDEALEGNTATIDQGCTEAKG